MDMNQPPSRSLSDSVRFFEHSCPRCGGDVRTQHDHYGMDLACMQCGYYLNRAEATALLTGETPAAA